MKVLMCIPYTGYIPPQAAYSLPPMACYARSKGIEIDMLPVGLFKPYLHKREGGRHANSRRLRCVIVYRFRYGCTCKYAWLS